MLRALGQAVDYVRFGSLYSKFKPYTMIHKRPFLENLILAKEALSNPKLAHGAIVECGTWKGGMAAALIEVGGPERHYYFFDSFEGLPPAEDIDGKSARDYQADTANPEYFDNCRASIADIKSAVSLTNCPPSHININPGFFEKSFPNFDPPPIALLRLDADWYSSTKICLEKFWNHVLPEGLILIDDYYAWDGCAHAVHEFLHVNQATERIRQGRIDGTAFIQRRNAS
jgi:O-methyltransferase